METKKHHSQNVERLRVPLVFSGLLFTGGLLLASFTFSVPITGELEEASESSGNNVQYAQVEKPQEQPDQQQEQTEYVAPPQAEIIIDSNVAEPPITVVTPPNPPDIDIVITTPAPPAEVIEWPDVEAEYPGGSAELKRFIANNVIYPEISIQMEDQGRVGITFIVEANGKITNVEIDKGLTKELDREAKRVIRSMPNWIPGENGGKKVRTRCKLPIVFTLE